MKIIAHRGYSSKYPENTILAFKKAIEAGADGIELDTHMTVDKKIIVHHFYALGTTNNGAGFISEKPSEYIRSLDAGSWKDKSFAGEKIPFLSEVFETFGKTIHYELELKAHPQPFADETIKIVQQYDLINNITFTSYQYPLLAYIKKQIPSAHIAFITPTIPDWMDMRSARDVIRASTVLRELDSIHAHLSAFTPEFVKELKDIGLIVHTGLGETEAYIRDSLAIGADEICVNDVGLGVKIVHKK